MQIALCLCTFTTIFTSLIFMMSTEKDRKTLKLIPFRFLIATIILSIFCMFCPSTKQLALMYAVPKILTDENVAEFTGETKELYNLGKQYIKEALTKKEEDKK